MGDEKKRSVRSRIWLAAAIIFGSLLIALYYFVDPSDSVWMPKCLWKSVTGTQCPGCGSQRMAHALLHGELAEAWKANPFALAALPFIPLMLWLELTRSSHPALYARVHRPWVIYLIAAAILAWWVGRNL